MVTILGLDPDFRLEIGDEPPALSPEVEARVAAIWDELKREKGESLFNAPVYVLDEHSPSRLAIRRMEYRHLAALRRAPELAGNGLGGTFMGVTGLTMCRDGLVLGRRSRKSFLYPGMWETAPAGTLDHPHLASKVVEEALEELGGDPETVRSVDAVALVFEEMDGVRFVDVLFRIELDVDGASLRAAHERAGTDEYSEIAVVAPARLGVFLAENSGTVIPALPPIIEWAGLLRSPAAP